MRRLIVGLVCCVGSMWSGIYAQNGDYIENIMSFLGTGDIEGIDLEEIERFEDFLSRPLALNQARRTELMASGLFTPYQAASIMDYRARHGDILSLTELSNVDGFDSRKTMFLRPFIILCSSDHPGRRKTTGNIRHDLHTRGAVRMNDVTSAVDWNYGFRYRLETESFSVSTSFSNLYDDTKICPSTVSGNLVYRYRKGMLVVGDFNARFGQGLCLWNTMTLGSYTSPSAFMRKPSGLSPTFSFTGTSALTGLCAEHDFGKWRLSALLSLPKIWDFTILDGRITFLPALNVTRYGAKGHVSFTQLCQPGDMKTSVDAAFCFNGVNLYGEATVAWNQMRPAATAGLDFLAADYLRLAALIRCLPFSNLYGAALSGEYSGDNVLGQFSADYEYYPDSKSKDGSLSMQLKFQSLWEWSLTESVVLKFRFSERVRSWGKPFKTQLRADMSYKGAIWFGCIHVDFLKYEKYGLAGYLESGYKGRHVSIYLRQGVFKVDDWDDRIYIYERDAPGNFTVPAYYGRGVWTSVYVATKATDLLKLYLRTSYITYPLMEVKKKKPGRAELKLHCAFRF